MRSQDKLVFRACAGALQFWLLVRRTNPQALQYIGLRGFFPKPLDCKAKTADNGKLAGLVVDPSIVKDAYKESKAENAARCWEEFRKDTLSFAARGYSVDSDSDSDWYGCVLLKGDRLHGDYDLYDVVDPKHARRNFAIVDTLHGHTHMRSPYHNRVSAWINTRIGLPVVQHSGEAQYADHSDQTIDVFGPQHEYLELPNEAAIRLFYGLQFDGRKALGKGVRW